MYMLSENSELLAKARHRLPLQYFFMIATGAIGTPCIIIALLNILLGKNLRFPEFDVLIGQQYRIAHDVGLLVVGVICFCAFLSLLHGT
jgi:hypothetical protein